MHASLATRSTTRASSVTTRLLPTPRRVAPGVSSLSLLMWVAPEPCPSVLLTMCSVPSMTRTATSPTPALVAETLPTPTRAPTPSSPVGFRVAPESQCCANPCTGQFHRLRRDFESAWHAASHTPTPAKLVRSSRALENGPESSPSQALQPFPMGPSRGGNGNLHQMVGQFVAAAGSAFAAQNQRMDRLENTLSVRIVPEPRPPF